MAQEFWYNDSGTWRKAKELYYNDAAVWRKAKELWYNDNGTWIKVFQGVTAIGAWDLSDGVASNTQGKPVSCRFTFKTDGTCTITKGGIGTLYYQLNGPWYSPTTAGIGNSYWLKILSGSAGQSANINNSTWSQINIDRYVEVSVDGIDTFSSAIGPTIQIASDSGGSSIVAQGQISLEAYAL